MILVFNTNSVTKILKLYNQKDEPKVRLLYWGGWWDSNPRLPDPQTGALPLNYSRHLVNRYRIPNIYRKSNKDIYSSLANPGSK
jgi:hypothetical protein